MKYLLCILSGLALWLPSGCKENPQGPSGNKSITHSGCKTMMMNGTKDDCLKYEYDGSNVLKIFHNNAGFNCCPEHFNIPVVVEGDRINIDETVVDGLCDCNCLYDISYTLSGIKPGIYFIEVSEPLIGKSEDKLILIADLTKSSGEYCITREHYPW